MKRHTDDPLKDFDHDITIESNLQHRQRMRAVLISDKSDINNEVFDIEKKITQLTLMEEICLMALGEGKAHISMLNDNIPYVLRASILLELVLARKIKLNIHEGGNYDEPWKFNVSISEFTPTGDVFLDEAIGILGKDTFSLQKWLDVLTGDTWSRKLSGYQMQNLRDRLCKSLMEKGVVTSRKTSMFMIETTEYPLLDSELKRNICFNVVETATDKNKLDIRSLSRLLSMKAANVLQKALKVTDAPTSSRVNTIADEYLIKYSKFHNLEARFGHLMGDSELHLIAGIFCLYENSNKMF